MKNIYFVFIFLALFVVQPAICQDSGLGLGLMLGDPNGLNAKMWLTEKTAFDAGMGWSIKNDGSLHIHADYLIHNYDFIDSLIQADIPVYFGIGGRIKLEDESRIGIRIPGGIDFMLKEIPLDIFIELALIMDLVPSTEADFNLAIGARYFF